MSSGKIGVDESGKGDYFGPLVVAACYVGPEHLAELEGVRDSKKLTDEAAQRLSRMIRRTCPYSVVVIGNERYNRLYDEIRNLNKLLAWGHARAIEDLITRQPASLIVSDQFANPQELQRRLRSRRIDAVLESRVRAESDIAVAAASILARAEFLRRLKMLSDRFELSLPKGAGHQVIAAARLFVQKHGFESLGCVAKLHFATTKSVIDA
jgi:ribonuclease HIII